MRRLIAKLLERLCGMEDPYNEGYDAYMAYLQEDDNPYTIDTVAFNEWEMGWTAASDADFSHTLV